MIYKTSFLEETSIAYLPKLKKRSQIIYISVCLMLIIAIVSLPFLYTDVSIKSQGIVRPTSERTEIKPIVSGIIDSIYVKDGDLINQNSLLVSLKDNITAPKLILNKYEIRQREQNIHDLTILTQSKSFSAEIFDLLQSPVYKQQMAQFIYRKADQEASIRKVKHEISIDSTLRAEKIIGSKEMFDKQIEQDKLQSTFLAFKNQQYGIWEQDLSKFKLELSQHEAQKAQITSDKKQFEIKSPITGTVQGLNTRYAGGFLQAGESLCIISPETELQAECYVSTQDVGLLKLGQEVKFQIDAFDYNYFGILTGKIVSIDNDFTMADDKPVFKVYCTFDKKQLHLKNGFAGNLKKGLTFQSRFIIARRSLWQLLFDKIDDWLNPISN